MNKIIQNGESFGFGTDNASGVNYNNTSSGLTSTTVQGAIDELNVNLTNKLKHYVYTYNATFTAGSSGYISVPISTDIKDSNLVSIWYWCAHIAFTAGLQLTPIFVGGGNLYVHYYSPRAITNEDIQFHIITCDNMPYATNSTALAMGNPNMEE